MRICDACGKISPLTIDSSTRREFVICASCVWRCAALLVEHHRPPEAPVRLDVIARST